MELLPRFELGTSSLPTDWKPRECRCSALSGHFCCGGTWSLALSCPLPPPAFFRVWVTVWVKPKSRSKGGAHLRERKSQLDCPLSLISRPDNLLRKLPFFCLYQFTMENYEMQVPLQYRMCHSVNNIASKSAVCLILTSVFLRLFQSRFVSYFGMVLLVKTPQNTEIR